jgi:hypothetical protein
MRITAARLGRGQDGHERVGEQRQDGPPVPGCPAPDLVLVQGGEFFAASEPVSPSPSPGSSMARTGWSIKRYIRTARRYGVIEIRVGQHTLTAEDPLLPDLATPSPLSSSQKGACTRSNKSRAHSVKGFDAYDC